LARNSWPLFNSTFGETLLTFQEKLFTFAAAQSTNWPNISSQILILQNR
jgi:hypothetical protein